MPNQRPFIPPGAVVYDQVAYQQQPQPFYPQQAREPLECDHCGQYIEEGEECLNLFHGVSSYSQKTGMPAVVESPAITPQPDINVHLECSLEYIRQNICDWAVEDDVMLCANCEQAISGDE